jgi:hypothetical protein
MKLIIMSLLTATALSLAGVAGASAAPAHAGGVLAILGAGGAKAEPVRCKVRRVRVCHRHHCRVRKSRVCW